MRCSACSLSDSLSKTNCSARSMFELFSQFGVRSSHCPTSNALFGPADRMRCSILFDIRAVEIRTKLKIIAVCQRKQSNSEHLLFGDRWTLFMTHVAWCMGVLWVMNLVSLLGSCIREGSCNRLKLPKWCIHIRIVAEYNLNNIEDCALLPSKRLKIFKYSRFKVISARLAQSVERWTLNPTVVGSSPTLGVDF